MDIWDIEKAMLSREPLTHEHVRSAHIALRSRNEKKKLIACEATLRSRSPRALREKALRLIKAMCERFVETGASQYTNLPLILLYISERDLGADPIFRQFLLKSVSHPRMRINAILVLKRFVGSHDSEVIEVLRRACTDRDPSVKKNAKYALRGA